MPKMPTSKIDGPGTKRARGYTEAQLKNAKGSKAAAKARAIGIATKAMNATEPKPKGRGYTQAQLNAAERKKAGLRYGNSPIAIAKKAIENKGGKSSSVTGRQQNPANANAIAKAAIKKRNMKNIARAAVVKAGATKRAQYVVPKGYEAIAKAAIDRARKKKATQNNPNSGRSGSSY